MVCDRCGAPEDTCHHRWDTDYTLEDKELYDSTSQTLRIFWWSLALVSVSLCIWGLLS